MKTRKQVELDTGDIEWFKDAYPDASLSWIVGELVRAFRAIHDDTGVTPKKIIRDAVKETKAKLDEGVM
jgi:hypothetical protein